MYRLNKIQLQHHALITFSFLLFSPFPTYNAFILVQNKTTTQTAKPKQKPKEEESREGSEIQGQGKQRRKGENAL